MILDKARQRASVKWILSKAYNNRVPDDLREPFYRDHEGQDHLKPKVSQNFDNFYSSKGWRKSCFPAIGRLIICLQLNRFVVFFFSSGFRLQIVEGLGNASIYCQTLSNLYSDPNYQNLNHWSILQTLSRKGVPVAENPDMLTETVLIRTNPLRIVSVVFVCVPPDVHRLDDLWHFH